MTEIIGTISGALAITGVLMNNRKLRGCFLVWMLSNSVSLGLHVDAGLYSLAVRDAVFLVLAVEGWIMWSRKTKRERG